MCWEFNSFFFMLNRLNEHNIKTAMKFNENGT